MVLKLKGRWMAAACMGLAAFATSGVAIAAAPASAVVSSDQQLAEAIAAKLGAANHLNGYQVDVTCDGGSVELNGTVKDTAQKLAIIKVVRGVKGVGQVTDRMTTGGVQPAQAVENIPGPTIQGGAPNGLPIEAFNGGEPPMNGVMQGAPMMNGGGGSYMGGAPQGGYISGPQGGGYVGGPQGGGYQGGPPAGAMISSGGDPTPIGAPPTGGLYDAGPPKMPCNAWPTYAPHNNYSRVAYPQQYPYQAFPFIGPFYPFPKVPPGFRAIKLEWEDGAWYYGRTATHRQWWSIRYW